MEFIDFTAPVTAARRPQSSPPLRNGFLWQQQGFLPPTEGHREPALVVETAAMGDQQQHRDTEGDRTNT